VGVSGGRDSVTLLHLLVEAGVPGLVVAHLDHALREASAEDAHFVSDLTARYGVPCVSSRDDVRARARRTRRSLETAARDARYAFFAEAAKRRNLRRVLLGHHADDRVETFLFNLLRGAGARGLGSMRPVSTHQVEGFALEVHRPLLGVWRTEIDAYVAKHALPFREDATNAEAVHTRNRLRHEVLPLLESVMGRDVRRTILRTTEVLGADEEFLSSLLLPTDLEPQLSVAAVRELPLAVQRRVLHAWLRANRVSDIAFEDIEHVRGLLGSSSAKVNLSGGKHARRRAGRLFLEPGATATAGSGCVSSSAMDIPDDLNYAPTHEWLRLDGANATVGITEHAARELRAIAGVTLPQVGMQVLAGEAIGTLHTTVGDREIHAPISGTIVSINEALTATPGLILADPYGAGWIFRMSIEAGEEIEPLESAAQYRDRLGAGGPRTSDL